MPCHAMPCHALFSQTQVLWVSQQRSDNALFSSSGRPNHLHCFRSAATLQLCKLKTLRLLEIV
ncbi:unnamed protein product [Hymenolepis diminuta]|uniref:Uncharacterized protein n=1 Tax=Hymenolepis diminuta TaxID=6216 RepID=A0A564YN60_HYMDI|nr:unnamed protein product [Hymenolepis diminuta]